MKNQLTSLILLIFVTLSALSIGYSITRFSAAIYAAKALNIAEESEGRKALEYIKTAQKLAPEVSNYNLIEATFLIRLLEQTPELKKVVEPSLGLTLERAIKKHPHYVRHYTTAGYALEVLGYKEESLKIYIQAIYLVPTSYVLYDQAARINIDLENYESALILLNRSVNLTQDSKLSSEAYYFASLAHSRLKNRPPAVNAAFLSLQREPDSKRCRLLLNFLESNVANFEEKYQEQEKCAA